MKKESIPIDVRTLLDEAIANTQPRKHHLVPASYLGRWAANGKLRVHHLDRGISHLTSPGKAARETDYYRAESEDVDPAVVPPMLFETMLGRVEEPAVSAIDQLLAMPRRINTQTRYDLSTFMAFQHVRGHRTRLRIRAMATEIAKLETRDVKDADIQQFLAEEGVNPPQAALDEVREAIQQLHDGNLLVQPQDFHAIAIAFSAAEVLAASIFERPWMVCMTEPGLITTDEPVLAIGGPGSPRTEGSGVAVAGIVAFPLSPERVLLAVRKDLARLLGLSPDGSSIETSRLDLIETLGLSRELLMSATRWAFEWPDRKVIDRLTIPTRPDDVSIEELASTTGNDSIVRHFNYTRWQNTDLVPDWPVAALWTPGWRSHPVPTWLAEEIEAHRRDLGSGLGHE